MGRPYFSRKEIDSNKSLIEAALLHHSYFLRSGFVENFIKKHISLDAYILELGSGSGELARILLSAGYRNLVLVDIDDYVPEDIKDLATFVKTDISFEKLNLKNHSIDLVLAIAVVEHLENPYQALRELSRVITPGGLMLVSLPHIQSIRSKLMFLFQGDLSGYRVANNHIALFTSALMKKAFADFEIIETHYSRGYLKLFGRKLRLPKALSFFDKYLASDVLFVFKRISQPNT